MDKHQWMKEWVDYLRDPSISRKSIKYWNMVKKIWMDVQLKRHVKSATNLIDAL